MLLSLNLPHKKIMQKMVNFLDYFCKKHDIVYLGKKKKFSTKRLFNFCQGIVAERIRCQSCNQKIVSSITVSVT